MNETPLRNEDGPRDWAAPAGPSLPAMRGRSSLGWRIATIALAVSTIVLAFVLAGRVSGENQLIDRGDASPQGTGPAGAALRNEDDLQPLLYLLQSALELNYSAEAGWPSAVSVDAAGTARTSDGVVLGTVPAGCILTYEAPAAGGYSLSLGLPNGRSAGVQSADYGVEAQSPPPAQVLGSMAYLMKNIYAGAWPDQLAVDASGNVSGPGSQPLGVIPDDAVLVYTRSNDGASFDITLTFVDGSGAYYDSLADRVVVLG